MRPLNLLFNHAQYALFGENVVAHRLFLATLHAVYAALLALIARRVGLPLPFALLAMGLAMCARYSVYHYVWLVEGHHYVQGLLFEGSLAALLAGLRASSVAGLALSTALLIAGALVREDTLALVPVLVVLGYVSLGPSPPRRSTVTLAGYAAVLLLASLGLLAYRAQVAPQAVAPGHDVPSFLVSVRRALNPMGLEHFDAVTHGLVLLWGALGPLLILALLVTRPPVPRTMPLVWLSLAVLACSPALTLRRDDLLLFPTAFVALFFGSALDAFSRGRPLLRRAVMAVLVTGMLGGAYVSRVYAQNFRARRVRQIATITAPSPTPISLTVKVVLSRLKTARRSVAAFGTYAMTGSSRQDPAFVRSPRGGRSNCLSAAPTAAIPKSNAPRLARRDTSSNRRKPPAISRRMRFRLTSSVARAGERLRSSALPTTSRRAGAVLAAMISTGTCVASPTCGVQEA